MKSDLELQLEASLTFVRLRKTVEDLTASLSAVIAENDLLRAERDFLELKLQRLASPRVVA